VRKNVLFLFIILLFAQSLFALVNDLVQDDTARLAAMGSPEITLYDSRNMPDLYSYGFAGCLAFVRPSTAIYFAPGFTPRDRSEDQDVNTLEKASGRPFSSGRSYFVTSPDRFSAVMINADVSDQNGTFYEGNLDSDNYNSSDFSGAAVSAGVDYARFVTDRLTMGLSLEYFQENRNVSALNQLVYPLLPSETYSSEILSYRRFDYLVSAVYDFDGRLKAAFAAGSKGQQEHPENFITGITWLDLAGRSADVFEPQQVLFDRSDYSRKFTSTKDEDGSTTVVSDTSSRSNKGFDVLAGASYSDNISGAYIACGINFAGATSYSDDFSSVLVLPDHPDQIPIAGEKFDGYGDYAGPGGHFIDMAGSRKFGSFYGGFKFSYNDEGALYTDYGSAENFRLDLKAYSIMLGGGYTAGDITVPFEVFAHIIDYSASAQAGGDNYIRSIGGAGLRAGVDYKGVDGISARGGAVFETDSEFQSLSGVVPGNLISGSPAGPALGDIKLCAGIGYGQGNHELNLTIVQESVFAPRLPGGYVLTQGGISVTADIKIRL
jgi:hypothetical protein